MKGLNEFGLVLKLVDFYNAQGVFAKSKAIPLDSYGAAEYLALVAYPNNKDNHHRIKFRDAMLSAALKDYTRINGIGASYRNKLESDLGIKEDMIWRDINRAITGGTQKVGGGTKKIMHRLHAYHVFRAYDKSLSDGAGLTFEHVLGHISTVYESKQSKVSEPRTRIENLKRIFRESRPVLHLTWGMVSSFQSKGWTNENNQICHGVKSAITDPSWIVEALDVSKAVLGLELVEHEAHKYDGVQRRAHMFTPEEIIHLYVE
ncbi:hypothetical protein [Vibrio diabolicus]|uniref:hypothetical protein n=1 Tax=Vibrio diabolicus TaxID=50719 RepID=UPI00211B6FBB|nr:hypothetical protein [Vibrio diabolicus]ELJ8761042.1 hypothetical protein [Vibrio parahaemolyticus]MCG6221574.1 hypothetical protein [Vibrio diabolicus]